MATVPGVRRLLASWFGTGLVLGRMRGSDAGSGTVGSLAALALVLTLRPLGWPAQLVAAAVVAALSVVVTAGYGDDADPGWVVIDEAAGTLTATIGLGPVGIAVGFIVFRIADIVKATPGVGHAERLPGGWGITADDIVAGGYGLAAGWLVQSLVG